MLVAGDINGGFGIMEGEQQVMSAYEAAFRKIKEATGVGDVNEVIQKFVTQKDTEKQLMNATKEAQAKIEALEGAGEAQDEETPAE